MSYALFKPTVTRIHFTTFELTFQTRRLYSNFVSLQNDIEKTTTKPIDMIYSERLSPELVTIICIDALTAKENGAHIFAPSSSKGSLLHKWLC